VDNPELAIFHSICAKAFAGHTVSAKDPASDRGCLDERPKPAVPRSGPDGGGAGSARATFGRGDPKAVEQAVLAFLNSKRGLRWVKRLLL
jgi:hypothetical protein